MWRIGAAALAGLLALFLMAEDAFAWRPHHHHRHHRRHSSFVAVYHFGFFHPYPYYPYRPYYAYPHPPVAYYPAPAPYAAGGNEILGAILGGIGGGVIGHQIGGGSGRVAATAAGAVIGTLLGGGIGRQLDDYDRRLAIRSAQYALEKLPSGGEVEWRNPDTGARGAVVPRPAFKNRLGQYCREYQQTVIVGGQEERAYGTACRQPDGQWQIVN